MALAEKLQQKFEKQRKKIAEKSAAAKGGAGKEIDSTEWILLFLAAAYIEILFFAITLFGAIPVIGQAGYPILDISLNILVTGGFFLYLMSKNMAHYWGLAFGGGLANLIPILNLVGWIGCVVALYLLVRAEKIPLAGEIIEKAAKATSKVK